MTNEDESEQKTQGAAVYVGWTTFKNSVMDGLAQGLPNVIDKSVFPGQSGAVQSQLMAALRFLALIDDKGKPTKALREIAAPDEDTRKKALVDLLKARYADVFAIGLEQATPNQLAEVMAQAYGVSGDTREKAIRFFLQAAQYSGVALSRLLLKSTATKSTGKSATPGAPRRRRRAQTGSGNEREEEDDITDAGASAGTSMTVDLASGGTLTVSATLDLFQLTPTDREFVFQLIDKLKDYKGQATKPAQKNGGSKP